MALKREERDGYALLKIEGQMTVNEAAAIRDEMIKCLDTYNGLILDLHGVSECDTAGIQLLCSARLSAQDTGGLFRVTEVSSEMMDTIVKAGLNLDAFFNMENSE